MTPNIAAQPATSFIGRQSEIAALTTYLRDPACRLLTLTGPAGSGKTRLAIQAAETAASAFPKGIIWCDLAAVTDAAYVPHIIAARLNIREQVDYPLTDSLADYLRDYPTLVVLDNCEHLLAAVAKLVHYLLQTCTQVQFLLTSLFPTGLSSEVVWSLSPFPLPDPTAMITLDQAQEYDAVCLFVERATAVLPGFALTAQNGTAVITICRRLDGLPLAIELAAARVRLLTPMQIADRLDDAFALLSRRAPGQLSRHQTLRTMMAWSFSLLSLPEQMVLQRLSIFTGSFDVEMVEALLPGTPGILDILADLLDKSLLTAVPSPIPGETAVRFRLLEVVRQYAREQLEEAGQTAAAQDQLLAWAVRHVAQAADQLIGQQRSHMLIRLQTDYPTIRAALRWAAVSHQLASGLRLAASLFRYWFLQGALSEGRTWLEELLLLPGDVPPVVRAWALFASGRLALRQWDVPHAERRGSESLALFRAADEPSGTAWALSLMALVAQEQNKPEQVVVCYNEALAMVRQHQEPYLQTVLLHNLGLFYHERGEYGRAESLYQEAMHLTQQHNLPGLGTHGNLADILALRGSYAAAKKLAQANLTQARSVNDLYTVAQESLTLGLIAYFQVDMTAAYTCYQDALALHRQMGTTGGIAFALTGLADVAAANGRFEEAAALYTEARHLFTELNQVKGLAVVHVGLGRCAAEAHQQEQARELLLLAWQQAELSGTVIAGLTAVTELAGLLAQAGDLIEAVRLLEAVQVRRQVLGIPVPPVNQPRLAALLALCAHPLQEVPTSTWAELVSAYLPHEQPNAHVQEPPVITAVPEPDMRVYLLGPVEMWLHERPLTNADWTYHKARELFFYLLAQPPANKAQIGLALWPEADTEQLRNEFHRTLYHLRRAVGHPEWVQFSQNRYHLDPTASLWCDLYEFERQLQTVRPHRRPGGVAVADRAQVIAALEAATSLWRGDFLAAVPVGDWAIEQGESLRQVCLEALLDLGQLYLVEANYEQAEAVFHRVLALDNFIELAHRELMRCYSHRGERSQAIRHYKALTQMLQEELGMMPSPETRLLYERLRRGDEV